MLQYFAVCRGVLQCTWVLKSHTRGFLGRECPVLISAYVMYVTCVYQCAYGIRAYIVCVTCEIIAYVMCVHIRSAYLMYVYKCMYKCVCCVCYMCDSCTSYVCAHKECVSDVSL